MFARLPSLKALHAFEAAARHRSFSDAANELSLTQGAISYQVKQLESALGTRLFIRRVRRVELTDAGNRLYQTAHRLFGELAEELAQITPNARRRALTISVSTYFVTRWLSPRLGAFLNQNPDITVRLQHSVNDPEFSLGDADLAIRWGAGHWPQCRTERLIDLPMIAVCSPKLLKGKTPVRKPADVLRHPLLRDQPGIDRWSDWLELAGVDPESADGPVIVDPNVRVQAAIDGQGFVLANPMIESELAANLLMEPFNVRIEGMGYDLIYPKESEDNPAIQQFRRWLGTQI